MTEDEYLAAKNLSNVSAAIHALHECTFLDGEDEEDRVKATRMLLLLEDRLRDRIRITPSADAQKSSGR